MEKSEKKKVLIVGAGGFVGGFMADEGAGRGYEVWAGVRSTTSRRYLGNPELKFIELDFSSPEILADTLGRLAPDGGWDWIIYNLGITKALNFREFDKVNHTYLRYFTQALKQTDLVPSKFLYMSSLSVMGHGKKGSYEPFTEEMIPMPNTHYGTSKLKAEMWLAASGIPHIIFRATGVYGPRDNDYYLMFKSIASGFDFTAGLRPQALTFIYVEDLARAAYDALERSDTGKTYIVSEPRSYSQKEFRKIALQVMHKRFVIPVVVPLWAIKAVCYVSEKIGIIRMKPSTLNRDKYNILSQRNWRADITAAKSGFGFNPRVGLREGLVKTIEWNEENNRL